MESNLYHRDIISVDDLSLQDVQVIFAKTDEMRDLVRQKDGDDRLRGKIMAALFFEPSTRTFSSFITAIQRLGGGIIPMNGMRNTSVEKGESYQHTITVFSKYADCLIVRHPQVGFPKLATQYSSVPVINAGDGIGEHPTQAIFDTYTILNHFPDRLELNIALIGDLKFGRTVHSLSKLLAKIDKKINFYFVSPEVLQMPDEIKNEVKRKATKIIETDKISDVVGSCDVLYMTRVQKERFDDLDEYKRLKSYYVLHKNSIKNAKKDMIIMHPLPIAAGEISTDLDRDKRSVYLDRQLRNGLYTRMALLDLILRKQ